MEYRRAEMRYFIAEDRLETVGKDKYNPTAPRVNKKTYIYKSQAKYTGEWRGNFRDGEGKQLWTDGALYSGNWKDGKAHGLGKFVHSDGDVYEGEWINDKANGKGVYIHVNGAQFHG